MELQTQKDTTLVGQLNQLQLRDHLALIYDGNFQEWKRTVVPFMLFGLFQNEKCVYILEDETPEQIRAFCLELGVNLKAYEKTGAFVFLNKTKLYYQNNVFDLDFIVSFLIATIENALTEGYSGLRITGDMAGSDNIKYGLEKAIDYEVRMNQEIFSKYPIIALCRYNINRYDTDLIKNILKFHPYIVWENRIHENPYYIFPEEYLAEEANQEETFQLLEDISAFTQKKSSFFNKVMVLEKNYAIFEAQLGYEKLKNEFLLSLSHEFRTPLNLMFTALQLLDLQLKADEKSRRYLNILKQNNYRLIKLVNNLLDITRIKSGSYSLKMQNCDIVYLARNLTSSVEKYFKEQGKKIQFICNVERKVIAIDPLNIERIMLNLLSNAIKATQPNDLILVRVDEVESKVIMSIADTGRGIKEEKKKIIFEQFRRVEDSFVRNSEGSGLGLWIVKSLVELHSGTIDLESSYGEGSEFIITLPASKLSEEMAETIDEQETPSLLDRLGVEFSDIYDI